MKLKPHKDKFCILFISIDKNHYSNYNLIYQYTDHKKASTITTHLLAFLYKEHKDHILPLFHLHYQQLITSCTQKKGISQYKEEKALDNILNKKMIKWNIKESSTSTKSITIVEVSSVASF